MSMRRQLYEWQINRQVNGYPFTDPAQGVTFEQIAGIPFSIFTGGIGNNITEPAATKATQFVAIDNIRCSPSFFLSGAAVLELYNRLKTGPNVPAIVTGVNPAGPAGAGGLLTSTPSYTPNGGDAPELNFQTTHINPFTSIAGPLMFMQVVINTTSYFDETDGTVGPGLPGYIVEYAGGASRMQTAMSKDIDRRMRILQDDIQMYSKAVESAAFDGLNKVTQELQKRLDSRHKMLSALEDYKKQMQE